MQLEINWQAIRGQESARRPSNSRRSDGVDTPSPHPRPDERHPVHRQKIGQLSCKEGSIHRRDIRVLAQADRKRISSKASGRVACRLRKAGAECSDRADDVPAMPGVDVPSLHALLHRPSLHALLHWPSLHASLHQKTRRANGTNIGHCALTRSTCACNVATVTRRPPHNSERSRITGKPDAASKRHKHRPLRIDSPHLCLQRRHGHREERSRDALPQEVANACVRRVSTGGEAQAT